MKNMSLVGWFDLIYSRLPNFSSDSRSSVVKVLPPLTLVMGVLMTFASVMEIIGTPFISVFTLGKSSLLQTLLLTNVLGIFQGIFMISAYKSLRSKSTKGWRLVFWSQILWIVSSLISMSPALLLAFLFLYPVFKVRSEYH